MSTGVFRRAAALLLLARLGQSVCLGAALQTPRTFAYVLQAERLAATRAKAVERLAKCGRDWIILDASYSGDEKFRWRREEIAAIRAGKPGRKVLAYLSIGEAEDYRAYWSPRWKREPPPFLLRENPDWPGDYLVKYWSPAWRRIILKEADRIATQGFDGLYLDKVDAFEEFEYDPKRRDWIDGRRNPESGRSYRADMVAWVKALARHVRRRKEDMLIVPQNGEQLLREASYRNVVDAIGAEDLFTDGRRRCKRSEVVARVAALRLLAAQGKPVLCIDYSTKRALRKHASAQARRYGYVLLITDRELTTLGRCVKPGEAG